MALEVNIVNDVIEFSQKDSLIVIILALSTLGLAIITAIALIFTLQRTKTSNEELKKSNEELKKSNEESEKSNTITERMLELTHRPILKLDYVNVWFKVEKGSDDTFISIIKRCKESKKLPFKIQLGLTNTGVESAQNIDVRYGIDFITNNEKTVDLTSYKNNFMTNSPTSENLESKTFDLDLPAHIQEKYEITNEIEVFPCTKIIFTLEISYTFLGNTDGYVQYIYEYTSERSKILFRNHLS